MSSFGTYLIGYLLVIIGVVVGAFLLNVPPTWIAVGAIVLLGLGVVTATTHTRSKDRPQS